MAWVNDSVLDSGVGWVDTTATRLDICTTEPTTYAEATSNPGTGYSLGNKTGINPDAPADRTGGGRMVNIPAITDGSVTYTGTAAYWALTNGSDTLVATGALSSSQGVTSGNTFTLTAFEVGIPDAA